MTGWSEGKAVAMVVPPEEGRALELGEPNARTWDQIACPRWGFLWLLQGYMTGNTGRNLPFA